MRILPDFTQMAAGSVLIECGRTQVLCTASVEDGAPPFLRGSGRGWLTAEYAMLPGSTPKRKPRDGVKKDGRGTEIQRLIGRSLRACMDFSRLGERTITVDCDVLQADGGTLFLDEIGELPLLLQAKLLRALQQGEVQRVGSDTPIIVDVRVIAATNRNLREEVSEGRFREDLYYRLNVIGVEVPSLRERREDIPVLATAFLERFALANRKEIKGFTPQAMDALLKYSWPGNVRELENAVERAAILCLGEYISERELPMAVSSAPKNNDAPTLAELQGAAGEEPISMTLDEMERAAILRTLQDTGDNKSEAARRLGITRATLHNKLRRYDME